VRSFFYSYLLPQFIQLNNQLQIIPTTKPHVCIIKNKYKVSYTVILIKNIPFKNPKTKQQWQNTKPKLQFIRKNHPNYMITHMLRFLKNQIIKTNVNQNRIKLLNKFCCVCSREEVAEPVVKS